MIYAEMMDWLAEFIGWNLSVGIYRCRAARGGLNFKTCSVCFDTLRGGRRKFYRVSVVVAQQRGGAIALYTRVWQLGA